MKCRLVVDLDSSDANGVEIERDGRRVIVKTVGWEIEHPKAWMLVRMGCAVPADDECNRKAAMTESQMVMAQHAQQRVSRGIHPDDYDAFDQGVMLGYNPDGTWIPGPNYEEPDDVYVEDEVYVEEP